MSDDHGEILRLRGRVHTLMGTLSGMEHRLVALEQTQRRVVSLVDDLVAADRIEEAVRAAMKERHTLRLTAVQKALAVLVTLVTLATPYVLLLLTK